MDASRFSIDGEQIVRLTRDDNGNSARFYRQLLGNVFVAWLSMNCSFSEVYQSSSQSSKTVTIAST
ncbi:hypothetical protein Plhal304r1_c092g0172441 [Plasmopara halstedii]